MYRCTTGFYFELTGEKGIQPMDAARLPVYSLSNNQVWSKQYSSTYVCCLLFYKWLSFYSMSFTSRLQLLMAKFFVNSMVEALNGTGGSLLNRVHGVSWWTWFLFCLKFLITQEEIIIFSKWNMNGSTNWKKE